jgi:hypothetical protein
LNSLFKQQIGVCTLQAQNSHSKQASKKAAAVRASSNQLTQCAVRASKHFAESRKRENEESTKRFHCGRDCAAGAWAAPS